MEFLPSSKLCHADVLSRFKPKNNEPLEDTVIASLQAKVEILKILCNNVWKLPLTLEEIRYKALDDNFIVEMKNSKT